MLLDLCLMSSVFGPVMMAELNYDVFSLFSLKECLAARILGGLFLLHFA